MKKHTLWLIELFVWIFTISILIFSIRYFHARHSAKTNTYHIFLQDIDGLMKGSPVKIMGVQVGYVTEINVIDDYMYVSFMIKKDNVEIPHGAKALIESYGIAGSKSIELYPPKERADETKDFIYVEEPIRASDAFLTQTEIAKTLITVSNGATSILDAQTVQQHKNNIQKLTALSGAETIGSLDSIDEKSDELIKIIRNKTKKNRWSNK